MLNAWNAGLPDDKPLLTLLQEMWPHYWRLMSCNHKIPPTRISVRRKLDQSVVARYELTYADRLIRIDVGRVTNNDDLQTSVARAITLQAIEKLDMALHSVAFVTNRVIDKPLRIVL